MDSHENNIIFRSVVEHSDIHTVVEMAYKIWREHYSGIISQAQIDYMLEKFQSENAIFNDIKFKNYEYYLFYLSGEPAGYAAFHREEKRIFLSKIYVSADFRQKGISRNFVEILSKECAEDGLEGIYLTVNRYNEIAIKAYAAMGFTVEREQVTDIGSGFVMDDFVMFKTARRI